MEHEIEEGVMGGVLYCRVDGGAWRPVPVQEITKRLLAAEDKLKFYEAKIKELEQQYEELRGGGD